MFVCTNCDAQYTKWIGRCLECGKWGTIGESKVKNLKSNVDDSEHAPVATTPLNAIQSNTLVRLKTTIGEVDRVLGGGIVPGSLILLGGEPGIGKSTLAMQIATRVPNTLYISGEESVEQIKMRTDRLGLTTAGLRLANATSAESIIATIVKEKPPCVIIDSIQTIHSDDATGEPGSVSQVRACTAKLLETAKATGTAILLVGHITKDGVMAGPKTLEHLVDTVLMFEGDPHHQIRLLRGTKNRFGSTDEVGLFDMAETGLVEVANP